VVHKGELLNKERCKVVCLEEKPKDNKLFFGDYGGFIRIDTIQYPQFRKLYEGSESNTWFPNEINYKPDIVGWINLPDKAKSKFNKTIIYQNVADSTVTNIYFDLAKVASVPELQYLYNRIGIEENIHSLTYTNGLNIVFGSEAEKMIDTVYQDKNIQKRLQSENDGGERFIDLCINQGRSDDEAKWSLLQLLGMNYILEGVKFPKSFYVTWSLNKAYGNSIQGFSRSLKLIGWDEMTIHTTTGMNVLNILRKDESQGFQHLFDKFDKWFIDKIQEVVKDEDEWDDYLLEDGETPAFNKEIGKHFTRYWVDKRLKDIGLSIIYNEKKSDIIDWFNKYRDLNSTTTALQEADATNYQKGKLVNDLDRFDT
jgi:ribonucleoside-diphosphate reductase beta chain